MPRPSRFYNFIDYIEQTTFGIACDAQANFRVRTLATYPCWSSLTMRETRRKR